MPLGSTLTFWLPACISADLAGVDFSDVQCETFAAARLARRACIVSVRMNRNVQLKKTTRLLFAAVTKGAGEEPGRSERSGEIGVARSPR